MAKQQDIDNVPLAPHSTQPELTRCSLVHPWAGIESSDNQMHWNHRVTFTVTVLCLVALEKRMVVSDQQGHRTSGFQNSLRLLEKKCNVDWSLPLLAPQLSCCLNLDLSWVGYSSQSHVLWYTDSKNSGSAPWIHVMLKDCILLP